MLSSGGPKFKQPVYLGPQAEPQEVVGPLAGQVVAVGESGLSRRGQMRTGIPLKKSTHLQVLQAALGQYAQICH